MMAKTQPKGRTTEATSPAKGLEAELEHLVATTREDRSAIFALLSQMAAMEDATVQYVARPAYNSD
jgi:hypothetical protein